MSTATTLPPHQLYARLLATAVRHAAGGPPVPEVRLRSADGGVVPMPLDRWLAPTTAADDAVVARAAAPVLDVGCGPGRLLEALAAAGKEAVGVDLVPAAVTIARSRGGRVVQGSIFAEVPGAGRWASALLLDGNIGIGADPVLLLRRIAALLTPSGRVIVELEPPGAASRTGIVRLAAAGRWSRPFPWARLGVDGVASATAAAGLAVDAVGPVEDRWFAVLSAATQAG